MAPAGRAEAPATSPPATPATPQALVAALGSDRFRARESATLRLKSLEGDRLPAALAALEAALAERRLDPERSSRVRSVLATLKPRAWFAQRRRQRLEWEARCLFEAYQKAGKPSPAYDARVRRALELYVRLGPGDHRSAPPASRREVAAAFQDAIDRGCDDPLVLTLAGLFDGDSVGMTAANRPSLRTVAEQQMARRPYPPAAMLRVWVDDLWANVDAVDARRVPAKLLPEVAKAPGLPPQELDVLAESYYAMIYRNRDPWGSLPEFLRAFEGARPNAPGPVVLNATALIDEALN